MPFKLTERNDGGLLCQFSGQVTVEDNLAAQRVGFGQDFKKLKSYSYVITDYTNTRDYTHTSEQVKRLSKSLGYLLNRNPKLVIAIVAPDDLVFGMARMGQGYIGDNDRLMIVRTFPDAEYWVHKKRSKINN